jgi:hypothetical protein
VKRLALFAALFVAACAHDPVTLPNGPGGVIVGTDATGVIFNNDGRTVWISEGVPAAWFEADGLNWHIDDPLYHQGNAIRLRRANAIPAPAVKPAATAKPGS